MSLRDHVLQKLGVALAPEFVELTNESYMHGLPRDVEKHFRLVIVSDRFKDLQRIERHRQINALLHEELSGAIHALTIQAFTPEEWVSRQGQAFSSPACLGGGKKA